MTRQILFIQGGGDGTHDAWDNKLVASLEAGLGPAYAVRYPRMPNEGDPNYASWKAALFEAFAALDDDAILVGHSIGGTFLIHAVAELQSKRHWGAIVLIAPPFLGEGGWPGGDTGPQSNVAELSPESPVRLYHGTADAEIPLEHSRLYAKAIPHAVLRTLADRDHQLNDDLSEIADDIRNGFDPR